MAMDELDATISGTPANDHELNEQKLPLALLTFDQVVDAQFREESWSRLGDLNPGPLRITSAFIPSRNR
jgi:hypothetical protein